MIEALSPIGAEQAAAVSDATVSRGDFAQRFTDHLGEVSTQISEAQTGLTQLATGESGDLHHVMLELSKAKLAFQLTLEIRNKLLEGYQDIMRMQI